jgi:ABC-type multidrug transport system ATPase subunit
MLKMFHKGLEITWNNVSIKVPPSRKDVFKAKIRCKEVPPTRTVIDSVSGRFPMGSFTILMGGSGAGKTTLLNYISQRNVWLENLECTGNIFANGRDIRSFDYKSFTSYVMQDDVLLESMTVGEAFLFAA